MIEQKKPYCDICHKYIKLYSHLSIKESINEHNEIHKNGFYRVT